MRTILGWGTATLCASIGWWLGAYIGLASAVILSSVAGGAGLYAGYRWFDQNLR